MSDAPEKDDITGKTTTGHEWDGIKELNTPLPKWWLNVFYATIVISIGYFVVLPAWPYFDGSKWTFTEGVGGYAQRDVVGREIADARAANASAFEEMEGLSALAILKDERLRRLADRGGASHYADNCAGCHGSGAQGFAGFPNLRDDEWIWGGELDAILTTIRHGVRWEENPDTRWSQMPAYGADGILEDAAIDQVTHYVLSLSGAEHDAGAAKMGAEIYDQQCSFCHGAEGGGMREVGAPALNDAIWLYGGDYDTVYESVSQARFGVMPAWENRLDDVEIKQLAVYVHLLGGGETEIGGAASAAAARVENAARAPGLD